jgi:hypothetical protein
MSSNTDANIGRTFSFKGEQMTVIRQEGAWYVINGAKTGEDRVHAEGLDAFIARWSDNPADVAQAARSTMSRLDQIRAGAITSSTADLSAEDRARILARISASATATPAKVIVKASAPADTGDNEFRDAVSRHVAQSLNGKSKDAGPVQSTGDNFADSVSAHVRTILKAKR